MPSQQTIALDAMGGDFGPSVVVPAASLALKEKEHLSFLFFGDRKKIESLLENYPDLKNVSTVRHTDKVVANDEKPSAALRTGRESSMRLAINAVKAGDAGAVVSAGNTGALMATAKFVLKCLPGISRPAIASVFPAVKGKTVMLDLGANLVSDAGMLVQFAILGGVYAQQVQGIKDPSIGLLNVGSEEMKGPDQIREAAAFLSAQDIPGTYYGFVEGNDIPAGLVDVVVTDGFTGNVALKVGEGVGDLAAHFLKDAFKSSFMAKIGALFAYKALKKVKNDFDPRYYNGGMFLGLDGICVKSHGGMDDYGFSRAILVAANLVEHGFNRRVADEIACLASKDVFLNAAGPEKEEEKES